MAADPVRDEAERLVAAAIAAVSVAARGLSGGNGRPSFATGAPECCVCPLCRVIAAMREPSPELSERLATGAGDLAAGVTSLLRAFGPDASRHRPDDDEAPSEGDQFWEALRRQARPGSADPWHAATTAEGDANWAPSGPAHPTGARATTTPKPMAKKAVAKKAVAKRAPGSGGPTAENSDPVNEAGVAQRAVNASVAKKTVAKKTVAKKTVAKQAVATKTVPTKAVATKAVATKTVATKTVAKKTVAKKAAAKKAQE